MRFDVSIRDRNPDESSDEVSPIRSGVEMEIVEHVIEMYGGMIEICET